MLERRALNLKEEMALNDLFFLESFADMHTAAECLSDLPLALFDVQGLPALPGGGYGRCTGSTAHPPGCDACRQILLSLQNETAAAIPYHCHRTGHAMAAIPLREGNTLLGFWRVGPLPGASAAPEPLPEKFLQGITAINAALLHMKGMQRRLDQQALMTRQLYKRLDDIAYRNIHTGLRNLPRLLEDLQTTDMPDEAAPWHLICFELTCLQSILHLHGADAALAVSTAVTSWLQVQPWLDGDLYHIGPRRFAVRMRCKPIGAVLAVCQRLRQRFDQPWRVKSREPFTTICDVAIAVIDGRQVKSGPDPASVIDRALSSAADASGVYHYNEAVDQALRKNAQLDMLLKNDVIGSMRGFDVHFQPIVDVQSGRWIGLEALCRWHSPSHGGFVPPDAFIPVAEDARLIGRIGLWVLETGVRQSKALSLDEADGFFLSVNVSPLQLLDASFAGEVIQCLHRHSFPGKCLNLEITESGRCPHTSLSRAMLQGLMDYGITLALDDFGTGYASFTTLKHLPIHLMKTERSFLIGIEEDPYLQFVIGLICDLSHANAIRLVAEGVENDRQLAIVKENGADLAQGYLFARPMNASLLQKSAHRFGRPRPKPEPLRA